MVKLGVFFISNRGFRDKCLYTNCHIWAWNIAFAEWTTEGTIWKKSKFYEVSYNDSNNTLIDSSIPFGFTTLWSAHWVILSICGCSSCSVIHRFIQQYKNSIGNVFIVLYHTISGLRLSLIRILLVEKLIDQFALQKEYLFVFSSRHGTQCKRIFMCAKTRCPGALGHCLCH